MKKQILNLGKALSKAEQKVIHGGDAPGPCRDAFPEQPAGCVCQRDDQCKSPLKCTGAPPDKSGWWKGTCA